MDENRFILRVKDAEGNWIEIPGIQGRAAGFGTPTAEISMLPAGSDPSVSVEADGPDTAKEFAFEFGIPEVDTSEIEAAEEAREAAEAGRVTAESGRVSAETSRVSSESARASAETARVSAESSRASAESSRASAESGRVSAETARASDETARASAESARASAETARASAESARATAEAERVAAEEERSEEFAGWHDEIEAKAEIDDTSTGTDKTWSAQKIAAEIEAGGKVKKVNGIDPDASGNVQIDAGDINVDDGAAAPVTVAEELESHSQQIANLANAKADKGALATTNAEVENIREFLKSESGYGFANGASPAYVQPVVEGALPNAEVRMIGGKSYAVNSFSDDIEEGKWSKSNGFSSIAYLNRKLRFYGNEINQYNKYVSPVAKKSTIANHVYYVSLNYDIGFSDFSHFTIYIQEGASGEISFGNVNTNKGRYRGLRKIIDSIPNCNIRFMSANATGMNSSEYGEIWDARFFDMTSLFGVTETSQVTDAMMNIADTIPPTFGNYIVSAQTAQIVSRGKNLYHSSQQTNTYQGFTANWNGSEVILNGTSTGSGGRLVLKSSTFELEPGDYVLSTSKISGTGNIDNIFIEEGNSIVVQPSSVTTVTSFSLTNKHSALYIGININTSSVASNLGYAIQIERGSSATSYVPYWSGAQLSIPAGLRIAYPLRSAGTAYDEYDVLNKKHKGRILRISIPEANFILAETNPTIFSVQGSAFTSLGIKNNSTNILSDEFLTVSPSGFAQMITDDIPERSIATHPSGSALYIKDSRYSTVEEFKTAMSGKYIYAEKTEETVTDVTDQFPETFSQSLPVERGGTVTFEQVDDTEIPIPNTVRYAVKLADTL